jgi:hypothetical protein
MFEKLMERVIDERNSLIDKCTKKLVAYAGCSLSENASEFEYLMLQDDLKNKGFKIKFDRGYNSIDKIYLVRLCDMYEELVVGYELDVRTEENKVSIVSIPIGNIQ